MNLVAFGLILIFCHTRAIEIDVNFGEIYRIKLGDFFERFRSIMRYGNSTFGIPVLEPFIKDKLPIKLNETTNRFKIELDALTTDIFEYGSSYYEVNSAYLEFTNISGLEPKLYVDLNWPFVMANINYSLTGEFQFLRNIFSCQVYGKGGMDIATYNFNIQTVIDFGIVGEYVQAEKMSTKMSLGTLDLYASGLYNDNDLSAYLSAKISQMVPKLIDVYQKEVVVRANSVMINILNGYLSTITIEKLLMLLGLT